MDQFIIVGTFVIKHSVIIYIINEQRLIIQVIISLILLLSLNWFIVYYKYNIIVLKYIRYSYKNININR